MPRKPKPSAPWAYERPSNGGASWDEIGRALGVSRERARQIAVFAVVKLQAEFPRRGLTADNLADWLP